MSTSPIGILHPQQNFASLPQNKTTTTSAPAAAPFLLDPMPSTTQRRSRRVTIGSSCETTAATKTTKAVVDLSQDDQEAGVPSLPNNNNKRLRSSSLPSSSRTLLGVISSYSCNERANANHHHKNNIMATTAASSSTNKSSAVHDENNNHKEDDDVSVAKPRRKSSSSAASTFQQQLQKAVVQKPVKGDRFQVFFDMGDDIFGKQRAGAKGWYFGTLSSIKRRSAPFEIQLQFDNGELFTFDYPVPDDSIERLVPSSEGKYILMGEFSSQFAVHTNPTILDVGDLVQVLYQNGGCNEEWYRGRVAAVTDDKQFCNVAYDDGEYERNVPLGQAKVMLLQDGSRFQHWLDGVKMHIPVGKNSKRKAEVTLRTTVAEEDTMVELVHHDETVERKPYKDIVRQLFDEAKERANTVLDWPSPILESKRKAAPKTKSSKATTSTSTKHSKKRKLAPADSSVLPTGPAQSCHADDFVVDPWLSDPLSEDEDDEDLEEAEEQGPAVVVTMKEITNSLRNSCWKMFNSAEGPYGFDLLFHITEFHNKMPNDELCRDLIQLLWKGPTHGTNGRIHFPDCVRMELANKYLSLLKTKPGMGTKLAKELPQEFWADFLDSIRQPAAVYCVEGDESRLTSAALTRVGQTLNVKNSGAHLLRYLLQHQVRGYSQFKKDGVSKQQREEFRSLLLSRPLTCDILSADEGTTHTLKRAVRAAFSVLIHYGHYLSNDFSFPDAPEAKEEDELVPPHATAADRAFVTAEVRKLLEAMGRIVSYMAWLWSIEEGQPIYAAKYVISGSVMSQLDDAKFDPSLFLTKAKSAKDEGKRMSRHWADMKLQFALSLDKRISGHLGRLVAEEFNILNKNELKLMFG